MVTSFSLALANYRDSQKSWELFECEMQYKVTFQRRGAMGKPIEEPGHPQVGV